MRHITKLTAVAVSGVLALAACSSKPSSSSSGASAGTGNALKACMVTDTGGIDDRSFNASSWAGMQKAHAANSKISVQYVASASENDYVPNLTSLVQQKCDVVVGVGGLMGDAVQQVASQNPNTHFMLIDGSVNLPNVYGLQYNTAQSAFLAGYLAAGMTKTGKVGTFGGEAIAPVTIYMEGFQEGVAHYNQVHGTNVQTLGYDPNNPKSATVSGSFVDQNAGKNTANNLISAGADIIFPVAGQSGLGGATAVQQSNGQANAIWVDFDGCVSAQQFCPLFLTSAVKNIPDSLSAALLDAQKGTFHTGSYIGTLANDGTSIAPYHDWDSKIPGQLKTEIEQLKADIISGKVAITAPDQPKA